MKRLLFSVVLLACVSFTHAQVKFISSGRIEFEKRSNQFSYFDKEDEESPWIVEMKKTFPKMVTETYVMDFNEENTVYKLSKEDPSGKYTWNRKPSENDITMKDVKTGQIALQRDVFEQPI